MMSKIYLLLIGFLLFHSGNCDSCQHKLEGLSGEAVFPTTKPSSGPAPAMFKTGVNTDENCIFYKQIAPTTFLNIVFTALSLGNGEMKIQVAERANSPFKTLGTYSGYVPHEALSPLVVNGVRYLKIVLPKDAGLFAFNYKVDLCPVPPGVQMLACTKDYLRDSHCIFACKEDYVSASLQDPKFYAQCRKNSTGHGEWTMDLATACRSKEVVKESCFGEDNKSCPYTRVALLKIFDESDAPDEAAFEFDVLKEVVDMKTQASETSRSSGLVMSAGLQARPMYTSCFYHCCRRVSTKQHLYKCGQLRKKEREEDCLTCRYSKQNLCAGRTIYF